MAEDIKVTENVPSDAQVARAKYWIGTGLGAAAGLTLTYIAFSIASGEWNPLDWPEGFAARADALPEAGDAVGAAKAEEATVAKVDGKEAAEVKIDDKDAAKVEDGVASDKETPDVDDTASAKSGAKAAPAAAAALPCAADEAVEKVCALPAEQLSATADSSCDGVISLTREALLQDTSYVTPEFVASIENPLVKAVYQAILDGDRSALTTALTNLYTENGYFNPANASGALDGLKDSIIIYPGDQIVIDDEGWKLVRASGKSIPLVNCEGELIDVKEEAMSDTGKCGDTKVIPASELPKEEVEPLCKTGACGEDASDTAADRPPTPAEAAAIVNAVSAEDIMAYDNGVLSPELKRLLIENNGAVLTNLYSDSSGASIPFIITEGPVTTEDLSFAAKQGYYDVTVGPNGERIYNFNVQRVGADELERPYCISVTEEQMKVLKRGGLDSIRLESDGYLTLRTPEGLISITDDTAPGRAVRLPEPINGVRTSVAQPTAWWESQIQRDATFRDFKTRG